ncbi:MAG: TraR/DksA family transcriptional regulator [Deltaproteobacteria bacterium]|nr:TraR/DksA family transcriptional regulator [Deltaproteobacteria bacterium]
MANSKKNKPKAKTNKVVKKQMAGASKTRAAKTKKAKAKTVKKKNGVKKTSKKSGAGAAPKAVKPRTKDSFKKEMIKKLFNVKKELLAEVAEKIKNESNTLKFEIGDIYDIASNERERELTLMLGDRDREKLAETDEALERIKSGTYGVCDECGEPIGEARLMALPFTKVCIDCKSKDEREKGARKRYEEEPGLAILEKTEAEEEEF